jgi:hypothetical protein
MKFIVGALLLLSLNTTVQAQRKCGTVMGDYSSTVHNSFDINGANPQGGHLRDTIPNEVINIPVIVHVLYKSAAQNISDAQIISQIKILNQDYRLLNADRVNIPEVFQSLAADVRLNFCLAQVDPNGYETKGIVRKQTSNDYFIDDGIKFSNQGGDNAWDCKRYLNIWVCNWFGSLGYASIPGGPADKDGVVIAFNAFGNTGTLLSEFNKGRTATHEIGHWLGLKHLWGDENCGNDGIDDTPRQRFANYYCQTFPHATTCSPNANGDMFMNYMDFSDDACMCMFTLGQKAEMRSQFALGGSRNSFLYSFACDGSLASGGPLPVDTLPTTPIVKPVVVPEINVFPNPTNGIVSISSKDILTLKGKTVSVFSTTGKVLFQQVLQNNTEKINISKLTAGIYILKIGEGADKKTFKIIKL